jgi:hypothetical protein
VARAGAPLDLRAPAVGSALRVAAEAATWSSDLRRAALAGAGVVPARLRLLAAVVVGSAVTGLGLLAVGAVDLGWGLTAEAAGVVAAATMAALAVSTARRSG